MTHEFGTLLLSLLCVLRCPKHWLRSLHYKQLSSVCWDSVVGWCDLLLISVHCRKPLRSGTAWRATVFASTFTMYRHTTIFTCTLHTWIMILQAQWSAKLICSATSLTVCDWWVTSINAKHWLASCEKMMNCVTSIASQDSVRHWHNNSS